MLTNKKCFLFQHIKNEHNLPENSSGEGLTVWMKLINPPEDNKSDEDDTPRKVKKRKRKQESDEPEPPVKKKKGRPSKKVEESPNIRVQGAGDQLCPICIEPQSK